MEAKAKDLLPQIMDAVETLRAVKPLLNAQYDSRNPPSLTGSQATTGSTSITTTELAAASTSNKKASSELGSLDLGLPIDIIPGLSAPKKEPAPGGGGESKPVKPKLKPSDGTTSKDGAKVPAKPKTAVASGNKGTVAVKEGTKVQKEKEKEDGKGAIEKEGVSEEISKEKQKMVSKPRNLKEEAKEKSVTGQKESSEKSSQDKATLKLLAGGGKEKDKSWDGKKGGKKEAGKSEPNKGEMRSEQKEQSKTGIYIPKGSCKESDVQQATAEEESQVQETVAVSGAGRRKQHAPTRRSARIASISELREESKPEIEDEGHPPPRQESGGSESDSGVEKKPVKQQRRRKRSRDVAKATSSSRKKARVLLSSTSEDSDLEKESGVEDSDDKEQGYESETEQPKEEDEKPSKKLKSKSVEQRKTRECELTSERQSRRSRKRGRPLSQDTQSQHQPKKLKKTVTKHSASILKKSFKLKLHRFSSVKTRYNRLVKPNRKYSPYGEMGNTESENSEEQHEEEKEEEKEEKEEVEEEVEEEEEEEEELEGDDSEEKMENISEEELPPKPAKGTSRRTK